MQFLKVLGVAIALTVMIVAASASSAPPPERRTLTYFPVGSLRSDLAADGELDGWYSRVLEGLRTAGGSRQPSLWHPPPLAQPEEAYRAVISYGHDYLMAILATHVKDRMILQADEITFHADSRSRTFSRRLTEAEWNELSGAFNATNAWSAAGEPPAYVGDCPSVVLEGRRASEYRVVSPGCKTSAAARRYAPVLETFERLSGWHAY